MAIQGLENKSLNKIRNKEISKAKLNESASEKHISAIDSINVSKNQSSEKNRSALLLSIRSKIKQGFYNSDSVLEDLSYGFAEALDQTV